MYICTPNNEEACKKAEMLKGEPKREISSAGSEHLPYKQGVTGSNPVSPTKLKAFQCELRGFFALKRISARGPLSADF